MPATPSLRRLLLPALLLGATVAARAQGVRIGTPGLPDASAALEVSSTTKGLLLPRLTLAQRQALGTGSLAAPVAGLVVFQTDGTPGLYAYDGTAWVLLRPDNLGSHTATTNLGLNNNWLSNAATAANGLRVDNAGQVGVGVAAPLATLDVGGGVLARGNNLIATQGAHLQWNRANGDGATWLLNQRGLGGGGIFFGASDAVGSGTNTVTEWGRFDGGTGYLGLGTPTPAVRLDVNGALVLDETASPAITGANPTYFIPANVSTVRLVAGAAAPTGTIGLSSTGPVAGQLLSIYNGTAVGAVLSGQAIGAGQASSFVYSGGDWRRLAAPGDNLGNHTATQALSLQANALTGTGSSIGGVGVGVRADGGLNLGQNNGSNVLLGFQAGPTIAYNASTLAGFRNTLVGSASGYGTTTGSYNTCSGFASGYGNGSGSYNAFSGYYSGYANSSGSYNVSDGGVSAFNNQTGSYNTTLGYGSGYTNVGGSNNAFSGYQSGYYTTSSNNTFSGYNSGINNTTGSGNTALGANSGPASIGLDNTLALGTNAQASASNTIQLGDARITTLNCQVPLTTTSDARFKDDVRADVPGLTFITALRPVTYRFDVARLSAFERIGTLPARSAPAPGAARHTGFLAQDVERTALALHYEFDGLHTPVNARDHYGLGYAQFVVPLVRAVQELNAEVDALKTQNAADHASLLTLQAQMARLLGTDTQAQK